MKTVNKLITTTAVLATLTVSSAAFSANSYQEVVETNAAALRANEVSTPRTETRVNTIPYSFQDVVDSTRVTIKIRELSSPRKDSMSANVPLSYQDVVNDKKS